MKREGGCGHRILCSDERLEGFRGVTLSDLSKGRGGGDVALRGVQL